MDISKLKVAQCVDDPLNIQCTAVMKSLPDVPVKDRIGILEQCLEYLRLEEFYDENKPCPKCGEWIPKNQEACGNHIS